MVNLNPFKGKIKYLKDNGKAQTLVRVGEAKSRGLTKAKEGRTLSDLKNYWLYYRNEGTVFASLNSTAYNTVMVGYNIESDDEEAKKLIQNLCDNIDLEDALLEATLYALIFGDAFLEKRHTTGGGISRLYSVDPKTMIINYDKYGNIISYQQEIDGRKVEKEIKPEDIIHIRFLPIPGSPYGVSLIEPNIDIIDRKVSVEEAIYNSMRRHGIGHKWVLYVGTEKDGQTPPDATMDNIAKKLEDINEMNEIVLPWFMKLETIDEEGIEGVEEYYDYFQTQLVVGLMCPEEALGQGKGSTEACYDEKTEILTKNGWKKYTELTSDDEIATYNPTQDAIEYHKSIDDVNEHIYEHDGPMIHFKSQKIDMMVTPEHRMWVNKNPTLTRKKWEFVTAEEIYNSNSHWAIKSRATREEPYYKISNHDINLMKLYGYLISEGCINHNNTMVRLSQKKEDCANRIKSVLSSSEYDFRESFNSIKGYEWRCYDNELCKQMSKFGSNCYDRHLTREVLNRNIVLLNYLLEAALDGDGTYDTRDNRNNCEYSTTSKQLADDILEIAIKCGYRAHITFSEDARDNRVGMWRVRIDLSNKDYCIITPSMCEKIYYKGKVHCLNVPNHIYLTRRNDKVAIQGNTARVKSIMYERMIKAYQRRLSKILRTELFNDILLENGFRVKDEKDMPIRVNVVFNSVTEEDEALRAKWLGNLLRGFQEGQIPFTLNEIRGFFDLPPREDMEVIPEGRKEPEEGEEAESEEEEEEEKPKEEEPAKEKPKEKKPKEEEESEKKKV